VNLTRRLAHQKDGALSCPFAENVICRTTEKQSRCAHYNPKTNECVHVEAARAQIRIAKELSVIAQTLECETINICRRGWIPMHRTILLLALVVLPHRGHIYHQRHLPR